METTKSSKRINKLKQYGDAIYIARVVNQRRIEKGCTEITETYVRMMLNGKRKITEEVHEVAKTYYKLQEKHQKELEKTFAN